jgi:pyruvate dehydrogenase E2 component (dihydrolipoamide acetyltransferase)
MAEAVIMPRQGQSVETCLIIEWRKSVGDAVSEGDILCEIETDKATFEVESTASGTLLEIFFPIEEDVPVLENICAIGTEGDDVSALRPAGAGDTAEKAVEEAEVVAPAVEAPAVTAAPITTSAPKSGAGVSPRAKTLAAQKGVDPTTLAGSGPKGRVIERDVQAAEVGAPAPAMTLAAAAAVADGAVPPTTGTGLGGRVTLDDLKDVSTRTTALIPATTEDVVVEEKVKGIRKLISDRMLQSLQSTAQLTLNASADARSVLALRKKFKNSPEAMGLQKVSINDIVMFAVSRALQQHPEMNALFDGETIYRHSRVHLGFAVDTERGLMVPTLKFADLLTLRQVSESIKDLAGRCIQGGILPEELAGATFTVSNLGAMGIENFTPVLNPPQVAILGVGKADLKPVMTDDGDVEFVPHMALSLTINHQVVDGAPAARFMQTLTTILAGIDVYLAG